MRELFYPWRYYFYIIRVEANKTHEYLIEQKIEKTRFIILDLLAHIIMSYFVNSNELIKFSRDFVTNRINSLEKDEVLSTRSVQLIYSCLCTVSCHNIQQNP
jgi:hypothetical protein